MIQSDTAALAAVIRDCYRRSIGHPDQIAAAIVAALPSSALERQTLSDEELRLWKIRCESADKLLGQASTFIGGWDFTDVSPDCVGEAATLESDMTAYFAYAPDPQLEMEYAALAQQNPAKEAGVKIDRSEDWWMDKAAQEDGVTVGAGSRKTLNPVEFTEAEQSLLLGVAHHSSQGAVGLDAPAPDVACDDEDEDDWWELNRRLRDHCIINAVLTFELAETRAQRDALLKAAEPFIDSVAFCGDQGACSSQLQRSHLDALSAAVQAAKGEAG